ncbi:MAG: FAD-dependent oxidoreductase [Nitrospirota bacterium]|jgi:NADPH-dependent 2,4-dienoyl-CoA reductase/sulfur reductase-like enzyme
MEILIIGGDAAGMSAASQVRRRHRDWTITVLERGAFTSYAACGIPYYLAGDVPSADDLVVVTPESFRAKRNIDVRMGWEALSLELPDRRVVARRPDRTVERLAFDRLLLATGASPVVPPWEGTDLSGVVLMRNLSDAAMISEQLAKGARRAVVIGAGYVGLEAVEAFRRRGLEITVLEKQATTMGGIAPEISSQVEEELASHGVDLRLATTVTGLLGDGSRVRAVATDGGEFPCDLCLISLGVRPNSQLAEAAGIRLGVRGAIAVDDRQRTGAPEVFAAGDCAEALHRVTGRPVYIPLALTANRQGRVAGANLAGDDERFPGIVGSAVTRVFDLTIARTGLTPEQAEEAGFARQRVVATSPSRAHYFPGHVPLYVELIFDGPSRRILGGQLAGRDPSVAKRCDVVAVAVTAGLTIDEVAGLDLTYAPPFAPVWDPVLQAANRALFTRDS